MSSGHLNAQYNLRLPADLKAKIEESAKAHNRSMNADMVARLEKSFHGGLVALMTAADLAAQRRAIIFSTYNVGEDMPRDKAHEISARYLTDFLWRNPGYQLINVEALERGIRFWYSYPVSDNAGSK